MLFGLLWQDKAEYRKALYAKIRRAEYSFASDKWDGTHEHLHVGVRRQ